MTETIIRRPNESEVEDVARVHRESWMPAHAQLIAPAKMATITDDQWEKNWRERLSRSETADRTLVAETDGQIVGIAFWRPAPEEDLDSSRVAELTILYVLPSRWRSGIGRLLLDHALNDMRTAGFQEAVLWVLEGNARAVDFYEGTGWVGNLRVDSFKDFGAAAVRYRLSL